MTFHVEYYFPFFRGTGITSREKVTVERHTDKEYYAGACDDLRIGVTMIFYLQNLAEYMQEKYKGLKDPGDRPVTFSGLASEGKILFPLQKDKEAVKVERELSKNRTNPDRSSAAMVMRKLWRALQWRIWILTP